MSAHLEGAPVIRSEGPSPGPPGLRSAGRGRAGRVAGVLVALVATCPLVEPIGLAAQTQKEKGWDPQTMFPHPWPVIPLADVPKPYFLYADFLLSGEAGRGPEVGVVVRPWEAASASACPYWDWAVSVRLVQFPFFRWTGRAPYPPLQCSTREHGSGRSRSAGGGVRASGRHAPPLFEVDRL